MRRIIFNTGRAVPTAFLLGAAALGSTLRLSARGAEQTFVPSADATLVDGGGFGPFDGTADTMDKTFDQSSYEGSITLVRTPPPDAEYRVIWEYNLSTVASPPPVTATLTFNLRGAALFPAEPAEVEVYAYPADLLESLSDFSAGPATLVSTKSIGPYQPATTYVANVSDAVNDAIASGVKKAGFRFQISSGRVVGSSQAFMVCPSNGSTTCDIADSDPSTKPFLTVRDRVPSDYDNDRDVDLVDYSHLSGCVLGPGVAAGVGCTFFDADYDGNVDLLDIQTFLNDMSR
ncbi:MAG: hypothetical protein Q7R41_15970 [Phycisphaerales bacterium]|nr:hypothetical protein [Phycisphaerales bacterium]